MKQTPGPIAILLKGYPRLSETFIAQEIRGLEQAGLPVRLYSLRHPTDPATHPVHDEIEAPVTYLPEYLHDAPARVWRAWRRVCRRPGYAAARRAFWRDFRRDRTRNRVRRFGQALVLAAELPSDITRIHAHFLHTPASVARYASLIKGLPWSCSAHAKDIWTTPDWELREKLADLDWLVTCTAYGRDHLAKLASVPAKVSLVYHGLDGARFPLLGGPRPARDGMDAHDPVQVLSVGRAVPKKGFEVLLDALAALPADRHWRWRHAGGGERLVALKRRAAERGVADRIDWLGPRRQTEVLALYRAADLFVLPCRIAGDGDRDGLPNVLMEAQSQALACLSTTVSAIPEFIVDGETGLLVPPDDPAALGAALERLIDDPTLRARLGAAGHARVRAEFSFDAGIQRLAEKFGLTADAGYTAAAQ